VWRGDGQIQQRPGARSALGRVKLDMPNGFNVYLHDTPGKALFAHDNRNLSHGCIRVQAILPLAGIVVAGNADEGQPEVEAAIARHATREILAPVEIPVYFSYWTAVAGDNGEVQFYPDVYGRDARLLELLHRSTTERVSLVSHEQ
jgi:murein L,D-transpeptidase YcbB/YkuD